MNEFILFKIVEITTCYKLISTYYNVHYKLPYYLLKIIQKFWLVKSGGWNRHIRSVVALIWSYDIIIEYWKHLYVFIHIMTYLFVYWKHLYDLMTSHLCQMRENTNGLCCSCQNLKYKWLLQEKGSQIQINNKTIIEFGSRKIWGLLRPRFVLSA